MDDCHDCSRPCKSISKEYFEMGQIVFCRVQMLFLISFLDVLEDGIWPTEGKETGYTDTNIQRQINSAAPFEILREINGEVSVRLKAAGEDGATLCHEVQSLHADDYSELSRAARNALNFVSGFKRRRQNYRKWIYQRSYKKNG